MVVLAGAVWLGLPYGLAFAANQRLPQTLGHGVEVQRVSVGTPPAAPIALSVPRPWLVEHLQHAKVPWPTWPIRVGLTAHGTWRDDDLDFAWTATVVAAGLPRADLALGAAWVNQRMAAASRSRPDDYLRWKYHLDPGSVVRVDQPPTVVGDQVTWQCTYSVAGEMTAWLDNQACQVRIDSATGTVEVTATRAATDSGGSGGSGSVQSGDFTHFSGLATVATCEHHIVSCTSSILRLAAENAGGVIAVLLNERLTAENLEEVMVPAQFPLDLVGAVVLTDAPLAPSPAQPGTVDVPVSKPALPPTPAANDAAPRPPRPLPAGSHP